MVEAHRHEFEALRLTLTGGGVHLTGDGRRSEDYELVGCVDPIGLGTDSQEIVGARNKPDNS